MLLAALPGAASAAAIDYIYVDSFEVGPDCSVPLSCPTPAAGKSCVSGQLYSTGAGTPLRAYFNAGSACGAGAVGGPCDLQARAYDAVAFAMNPAVATPLASAESTLDACGRFRFADLTPPAFGFVAIVVDDADSAPESDLNVLTGSPRALAANGKADGVEVLATRRRTMDLWTQSAGNPYDPSTFADVGVLLMQFRAGGLPRSGVTVTANGNVVSGKDFYFSDAPPERVFIDPAQLSTGANGAALLADNGQATYSGNGGEPMGCTWPSVSATTVPGVVLFVPIDC